MDQESLEKVADARHIKFHCKDFYEIKKDGILHKYVDYLHETTFADQKQLPNPTIINSVNGSIDDVSRGKTLVFTAYMSENFTSTESDGI